MAVRNARQAAQTRGFTLQVVEVRTAADLDGAFAALKRGGAEALLVAFDGVFFTQRAQIAELALAQRLPAMFANTEHVEAGGLISYSPSSTENYRRAGAFIDKILRGANPGEIPVEQPTKFELAVNMRTAKAMGVLIPQSLVLRRPRHRVTRHAALYARQVSCATSGERRSHALRWAAARNRSS